MLKRKMKKIEALLLAVVMLMSVMAGGLTVQAAEGDAVGTSYYLDADNGDDNAAGTSPSAAWKSLEKLEGITFQPGDRILLKAGSQFTGKLHPQGSGSAEHPITVDIYDGSTVGMDAGNRAAIHGAGLVKDVIYLNNVEYWNINNLEITNTAAARALRTGVMVEITEEGVYSGIHLDNLFVHDIYGDVKDKDSNGGIYFVNSYASTLDGTDVAHFNDISVQNCHVKDVSRTGISVGLSPNKGFIGDEYGKYGGFIGGKIPELIERFYHTNVVIRNNYVENAGGDAIVPMYGYRPVIEYNVSNHACEEMPGTGQYSAGIWPWRCVEATFQFNEAYDSVLNGDGQAYDCDFSVGTVYQYNYSHDNEGGFMLVCQEQAVESVIRYNVSQNDLRSVFMLSNPNVAQVYNNTIYVKEGTAIYSNNTGKINLENNIFYYAGATPATANWTRNGTYDNNLYYGFANTPAGDANKIVADPLFVDPGKGGDGVLGDSAIDTLDGYKLQAGSPAIDAGKIIENNGGRDYAGNALDDHPDIGAFEFVNWSKADLQTLYDANADRDTTGCTDASKARFEAALVAAKAVLDQADPSAEEIGQAYGELNAAAAGLQLKGDTTELKQKYDEYLSLRAKDYEYSISTWAAVEEAAKAAKAVLDNTDPGKADVDEALEALTAAIDALEPAECNLMANGNFEKADLNKQNQFDFGQWSTSAGPNGANRVSHDVHSGNYAAEFIGPGDWGIWLEQKVAVEPNTTYRLSGWLKLLQANDPEPLALSVNDVIGVEEAAPSSTEYEYVETTFTTTADQTWIKVYIGSNGQGGYADDIVLVKDTDKETLTKRYQELRSKNAEPYSAGSWANLTEALRVAGGVLMNAAASQEEIDNAVAAMNTAEANLVNISTLKMVLAIANAHVTAGDVDKLIPAAKEQFNKTLTAAQGVYDNADATQEQADKAWKDLISVIQALGFVPGDKTDLTTLVESLKGIDLSAYEDGAEKEAFETALAEAISTLGDENAMKIDIDAAQEALQDAYDALKPVPEVGDKTQLGVTIAEAESYKLEQYVDDANKTDFLSKLAEAKDMYDNNDTAAQAEIDQMNYDLLVAMNKLRLRADKENLNKWLEDLKAIDLNQYTAESAAAVREAIIFAESVAAQDLGKDQADLIAAAIARMESAYKGLVPAPEEPEDPSSNPSENPSDSSTPDSSAPSGGTSSAGKQPTTGDSAPIAVLSVMAVAAAGAFLLIKKRKS